MARVLVADPDGAVRAQLVRQLVELGHAVLEASTGQAALELADGTTPHLLLLEFGFPDMTGDDLARRLRARPRTRCLPFMFVSRAVDPEQRIRGLEAGAEDFVVKPFHPREVALRVQVVLRRSEPPPRGPRVLSSGPLSIDPSLQLATLGAVPLPLTRIEFRLLSLLVERQDQPQSRELLLSDVWGAAPNLETRTVDNHIKRLRAKLGALGDSIETVRGIGYRFRMS